VVVEQAVHLILVPMVVVEEEVAVSATFHPLLFLLRLHTRLQLVLVEQVETQQLPHLPVEPKLNQEVVAQVLYSMHPVAIAYLPLLQLAVVQVVLVVLLVDLVDLVVVNHIQDLVEVEILEEQNQEQIQHLKEILLALIRAAFQLVLMDVVVAVEQIQLTPTHHSKMEIQV
tara:strand:- start:50 stop:562 length:513 start_codon:yes stop_codon:yes gene_type:complete